MNKKYVFVLTTILLVMVASSGLLIFGSRAEAFEWWKPFKYEKWNCCNNTNFSPFAIQESNSHNEIIQNLEINQICENVEVCLIDLSHLNNQISYSNIK